METTRIAELLAPFAGEETLAPWLLESLQRYLDLLLRWNARMNLTAVREPETIVARHFGESLFAAQVLLGRGAQGTAPLTLADVGSGAGFPGIPMKLFAPAIELTLIESHNKKATFLREVVRSLGLDRAQVFCGRAEHWARTADLVTLRAVEQFERALLVAAKLVGEEGRLGLLIVAPQVRTAQEVLGENWDWAEAEEVPRSKSRLVVAAKRKEVRR